MEQFWETPTLEDLPDPTGKRVLVRATLDLPLGGTDATSMARRRADWLRSTVSWLVARSARVTVCGDAGAAEPREEALRFARVREIVAALVPGVSVADDTSGGGVSTEQPAVIETLVASHDLYVNDSFQWSHLPLPSLTVPPSRLPAAIGRTVEHDLRAMAPLLDRPDRPFTAVLGGDRCFPRLHGLEGLVLRADTVVVGGAMALPFLQATGRQPLDAAASPEFLSECRRIYGLAERVGHRIQLPIDLVWARDDGPVVVAAPGEQPGGHVVDIGPRSGQRFAEVVTGSAALIWSGSLGHVEDDRFAAGTRTVASALGGSVPVVGGDALMSLLDGERLLPPHAQVLSATDSALELLKVADLPALAALRAGSGRADR